MRKDVVVEGQDDLEGVDGEGQWFRPERRPRHVDRQLVHPPAQQRHGQPRLALQHIQLQVQVLGGARSNHS